MGTRKKAISLLLILTMMFCLCAAGGTAAWAEGADNAAEYAREYSFVCARMNADYLKTVLGNDAELLPVKDQYITEEDRAGNTVRLDSDGTGYLDWGEDNRGNIDRWTAENGIIQFEAGISVIDGTIFDGIMTLKMDDGLWVVFAAPDADLSSIRPISSRAFAQFALGIPEGEYTMFAMSYGGQMKSASELNGSSVLTLSEGGKGNLALDEDNYAIDTWSIEGDVISLSLEDGSVLTGTVSKEKGVIALDFGGYYTYYGREGSDTDSYLTPGSLLYAFYDSIDPAAGARLRYSMHSDYMDSNSIFDVQAKDGMYYSRRTTQGLGYEGTTVTFFRDGKAYNLDPEEMTGILVTTVNSSLFADNILKMDGLYSAIAGHARRPDYTTETRELDGVSCTVEVYPATSYEPETSFWFDAEGKLLRCEKGAPVIEAGVDIGETLYTVESIDTAVDVSCFDISGYQITE